MIVALAGLRIDPQCPETLRFPESSVGPVRNRIRQCLKDAGATALVASGASGSDLLGMDVAGELGIRRCLVLPFEPERFRVGSVVDRPGNWGPLFDRVAAEVAEQGKLIVLGLSPDDTNAAYVAANIAIFEEAGHLAGEVPDGNVLAVVVSDSRASDCGTFTAAFAREAELRGFRVVHVSTLENTPDPRPALDTGIPSDLP
jgi:hypothetical protein